MIQGYMITEQITMATSQCGGLKRKYQFSDEDAIYSSSSPSSHSEWDSEEDSAQSDTVYFGPIGPFPSSLHMPISSILKKRRYTRSKGSVHFGLVTVFFFQRCQGCCSVPSHGGCTLGMVKRHAACQQFTLREHAEEQQHLQLKRLRERHQEERLEALRQRMISSGALTMEEAANLTLKDVPDEDVDLSSAKLKDGGFLRPYSSKRRRALLKAAGVVRIDREEKRQLQELRRWREDCGCHCQGFCYPETCDCSQAGIKCQMDRTNFPCGCSKEVCGNPAGRIEFNSSRVQSHYIHTHMKLELEKRLLVAASEQQSAEENRSITFTIKNNSPAFQLSSDLCREAEKSSSSDVTDTSCSSALSQDFDMDGSPHELGLSTKDNTQSESNTSTSQLKYLDENANQATLEFVNDTFDIPNTPSPSTDNTADCYMDLSLSSVSDLVFFDRFHEYNHFKVYSHMDYMSHIQFPSCPSPAQIEASGVGLLESLIGIS